MTSSHKKKKPEDLKIAKPLSLHPLTFEQAVETLLMIESKKRKRNVKLDNSPK